MIPALTQPPPALLSRKMPNSILSDNKALALTQPLPALLSRQVWIPIQPQRGGLLLRQVSLTYPDGRCALQALDFTLQPGERIALIGLVEPVNPACNCCSAIRPAAVRGTGTVKPCPLIGPLVMDRPNARTGFQDGCATTYA